jgi:hypothetical protein
VRLGRARRGVIEQGSGREGGQRQTRMAGHAAGSASVGSRARIPSQATAMNGRCIYKVAPARLEPPGAWHGKEAFHAGRD